MADTKTSADTKAAAAAAAPAAAAAGAVTSTNPFDDAFDVHPAGLWDTTPFGVAGAWPFAAATSLVPPLPAFGSFAFPSFPPLPALPVPVWNNATAVAAPKIALDLVELPDRFTAIADMPGVHAADIDVRVDRDARLVSVAVVRRRTANCDCNFVQSCATATASAGASAGTKAAADPKATAVKTCELVCDNKCKGKAVHCRDCEAKGELMGPASPATPLVNGCCGFCAGALHLKSKCGRGAKCASGGAGAGVYRRSERQFGRGERSFRVPSDADLGAIASSLRGGVLTITVPRTNAKAKTGAKADPATEAKAHSQYEAAGHAAAAAAADPKARAALLQHHVTAPNDNPTVIHERVMRAAVAAGADPRKRAALLTHHMLRADPLTAWAYSSPFAAYSAMLPDVMSLAHDFGEVSHHVARPAYDTGAQNPLLLHERVMRQAVAAANAHSAQAQAHSAAAVQAQAAANAQMAVAAQARVAAAEMAADAAAASAAGTAL